MDRVQEWLIRTNGKQFDVVEVSLVSALRAENDALESRIVKMESGVCADCLILERAKTAERELAVIKRALFNYVFGTIDHYITCGDIPKYIGREVERAGKQIANNEPCDHEKCMGTHMTDRARAELSPKAKDE